MAGKKKTGKRVADFATSAATKNGRSSSRDRKDDRASSKRK
jgi:hypothetical protein